MLDAYCSRRRLLRKEVLAREDGGDRTPNMPNRQTTVVQDDYRHAVVLREGRESEAEEG